MAFTSTPQFNTQQTKRVPIQGSAMPSFKFSDQGRPTSTYLNCYPVSIKQYHTDPIKFLVKRMPLSGGSTAFWNGGVLSSTYPRGFYAANHLTANNSTLYAAFSNTVTNAAGNTKTLQYSSGYVGFCEYRVGSTYYVIILENHATAAYIHLYEPVGNTLTSVNLGVGAQGDPVFMDGYIFFCGFTGTQRIYNSTIGAPDTYSVSTDFIDCEQYADDLYFIAKHKNHIVGFGKYSIEFFYNNANQLGSPLTRNITYSNKVGVGNPSGAYSIVRYTQVGDDIYFYGAQAGDTPSIFKISDFQITDISNAWIKKFFSDSSSIPKITLGITHLSPTINLSGTLDQTYNYTYIIAENVWVENVFFQNDYEEVEIVYSAIGRPVDMQTVSVIMQRKVSGVYTFVLASYTSYEFGTVEDLIAQFVTDQIDFDTNNSKHIRNVELLGNFYGQAVKLEYTKDHDDPVRASWTDMGIINTATAAQATPYRWRELGWGNLWRFRWTFGVPGVSGAGDTRNPMMMRGFEVTFVQHQD